MSKSAAAFAEAAILIVAAAILAAAGNAALGDDGIRFSRDYFPVVAPPPEPPPSQPPPGVEGTPPDSVNTAATGETPAPTPPAPVGEPTYRDADWFTRVLQPGELGSYQGLAFVPAGKSPSFQWNELTSPQAQAFHEAGAAQAIVFVDARTPENYSESHIPGAISLSHFLFDKYWPEAQTAIWPARAIVIYCNGGDCDDSEHLAGTLVRDIGLRPESIYIYRGGIMDWKLSGRPMASAEGTGK